MSTKIKIASEQANTIKVLAKETGFPEIEVAYIIIEIGVATLIASRKTIDNKDTLAEIVKGLDDKIQEDSKTIRLCQLLEKYWDAGQRHDR